jgi:sterol 14alpha-demethylase
VIVFATNMGLLGTFLASVERLAEVLPLWQLVLFALGALITLAILLNIANQLLFRNPDEPPLVFHLLPFIGSTITYGIDPFVFFFSCREKVRFPLPVTKKRN